MKKPTRPPSAQSRERFLQSVSDWAVKLKVSPREIHLRPMSRKWASCSTNGRLSFSCALLQQPRAFRNEVIVHELLHLRLPNHGRLFKRLLALHQSGVRHGT